MSKINVSAIIIAKNEERMIANCIETVRWCTEIIVLDCGSDDTTRDIAEHAGARVISFASDSFSRMRNEALKHAKTDWIFYVDADERVTPQLAREIMVNCETKSASALAMTRKNIMYGKEFSYGGWNRDLVTRVFKRSSLKEWQGKVHESPVFSGSVTQLHTPLIHLTHRNTRDGLLKTAAWTAIEAELLAQAGVPPVTVKTLIRKPAMEFYRRAFSWKGYKDGFEGWVEAFVQAANKLFVYIQVWEHQRTPSLHDAYQHYEEDIAELWRKDTLLSETTQPEK